jgi:hypothetical protein
MMYLSTKGKILENVFARQVDSGSRQPQLLVIHHRQFLLEKLCFYSSLGPGLKSGDSTEYLNLTLSARLSPFLLDDNNDNMADATTVLPVRPGENVQSRDEHVLFAQQVQLAAGRAVQSMKRKSDLQGAA